MKVTPDELHPDAQGGWCTMDCADGFVHVVPLRDLRPHMQHDCWCKPGASTNDDSVILHNSMDQREAHEQGAPLH
jgi:hypothetical protein